MSSVIGGCLCGAGVAIALGASAGTALIIIGLEIGIASLFYD